MKAKSVTLTQSSILISLLCFLFSTVAVAQITETPDSVKTVKADTIKTATVDTLKAAQAETEAVAANETQKKDKKGKKNKIVFYTGINFTDLSSSPSYDSEAETGYQLGAYYKQGRFVYWQAGARFATSVIGFKPGSSSGTDYTSIKVSDVDFPLTLGLNFTSFMDRVLGVRLFVSAVPAFTIGVNDNSYITKDDLNSFLLYGQGGIGIDFAFLVLETGYNYGFNEIVTDDPDSKPGQLFINLGFRF